jgi:sulfonate transport system ATP-binding protein
MEPPARCVRRLATADGVRRMDGLITNASLIIGVSGGGAPVRTLLLTGLAGLAAGSLSMAAGEYISVTSQNELIAAETATEQDKLARFPDAEQEELTETLVGYGLNPTLSRPARVLRGGEQQRVALARSVVREPELLLADEPFGALDALTRIKMHGLLRDLHQRHRPAVLLATHDVDEAIELADRVLVLDRGRIAVDRQVELPRPGHTAIRVSRVL